MSHRLKDLSYYQLVYELLQDGRSGAFPTIEPVSVEELVAELSVRSSTNLGMDKNKWVHWFLANEQFGTAEERESIKTVKRITDIERKAFGRIEDDS